MCSSGFERVPGGPYLGNCAGCNCNGHASACDPISGHCLVIANSFWVSVGQVHISQELAHVTLMFSVPK